MVARVVELVDASFAGLSAVGLRGLPCAGTIILGRLDRCETVLPADLACRSV